MEFQFRAKFGIDKPHIQVTEKFLIFFVVGGKEISMWDMIKNNLVVREYDSHVVDLYSTSHQFVKVFVGEHGQDLPSRHFSFYLKLTTEGQTVRIVPYMKGLKMYFEAKANFLRKSKTLELLEKGSTSWKFCKTQTIPPKNVLRSLVSINKSSKREGVRVVQLGRSRR